jgi:hypothetical protein
MKERLPRDFAAAPVELAEKILGVAALAFAIELVLFKFLPDISTAAVQGVPSKLTDFEVFRRYYLTPDSVHYARFLGNHILYRLATALDGVCHTGDMRLHPLRVAAGILTPLYVYLGAHPVLRDRGEFSWRYFFAAYSFAVLIGLYVFYPGDLPSLAFLSISLFFLLRERLALALVFMLITGLFRETSLHAVFFVAIWAMFSPSRSPTGKATWLGMFAGAFLVEYVLVRHFFPGPVASAGGVIFDPRTIFFDPGFLSLTTLCSLGLAALFPIVCLLRLRLLADDDWRRKFFALNCYSFPLWVVFYRMMSGNLSEFRILLPVLLPCIYGISYAARQRTVDADGACQSGT